MKTGYITAGNSVLDFQNVTSSKKENSQNLLTLVRIHVFSKCSFKEAKTRKKKGLFFSPGKIISNFKFTENTSPCLNKGILY